MRYLSFKAKDKEIFGPHYLSLICELPASGRYRVSIEAVEGPSQGQVQLFRNEVGVGEPVDLYFEVRRQGKPVDPAKYLPAR